MKITIDDLKSYGLYDLLPKKLKEIDSSHHYCFYYSPDYDNSKIVIIKDFIAVELNTSLYRDIFNVIRDSGTSDIFLGTFKYNLETRDGLLYLLLNTFYPKEILESFYARANEIDMQNELRVSNSARIEILSRESFSGALAYFMQPEKLNTVLSIYDMVNNYVEANFKRNLYGGYIKEVVQLITSQNGIMSQENGNIRLMTIGEKANLSDVQIEKLKLAKSLLRSLEKAENIYIQTGWYFNNADGLWRTNISDNESVIDETLVRTVNDQLSFYYPPFCPASESTVLANLNNPTYLFNVGYNGKLSDILKHELLYRYYPQLATLDFIFAYNQANRFYFSDSSEGLGFINIQGDKRNQHILSILLHETQHAIQHIEGFATGGNSNFADFVIALGGKGVRPIFASIFNFQKFITTTVINDSLYSELKSAIESINALSDNSRQLKSQLLEFMVSYDSFRKSSKSVGIYLIYLITDTKVFNEGQIIDFLERYYGDEIYEMFEQIKEAIESADLASEKLKLEGFSKEDIRIINFNTYQNLLGEMEARGTQHQMRIPINLSNYFFINEWEKSPTKSVAVIGGEYMFRDTSNIKGACETTADKKYILHFNKDNSSIPFIHELGHIVHDILVEKGFGEILKNEYDKEIIADSYQEYFVNVFLGYIRENFSESLIGRDFYMDFSIKKNELIFGILTEIFNPKPNDYDEVMQYLKTLEEQI